MNKDMLDDITLPSARPSARPSATLQLEVRYFAGAAAAVGVPSERVELSAGADVAALRAVLVQRHPRLEPVLDVATLLVDEVAVSDSTTQLSGASQVDVLPPFAGG